MNLIEKGLTRVLGTGNQTKAVTPSHRAYDSRGVMGRWVPGMPAWWGQPPASELASGISAARMREIVLKTPTASAALNAILDYACGVKVHPRNVDTSQKAPARATKFINDLLSRPNSQDTERRFRRKLLRDLVSLGYALVEIDRDPDTGTVANLYVLDAARTRVDFDKHGKVLGYDMLDVYGMPIPGPNGAPHTWEPDEVIYFNLDTISESLTPHGRIEQLFACAVIESMMMSFIGGRFIDSNIPFGMMDLGDISETELDEAIALWNQQMAEKDHPESRIVFTGSKGGAKWIPFGYALKDLEAPELLSRVRLQILAIMGVTVNELGEADNVNKSNGYNLTYTFKKRSIEPVLDEYTATMTRRLLWDTLSFTQVELYYEEIDSRDELLQSQIDDLHLKAGVVSINQVRNRRGDADIVGGEEPTVNLGGSIIPISMLTRFAEAQAEALEILNIQARVGVMQAIQQMQQAAAPQIDPTTGQPIPGSGAPPLDPQLLEGKMTLPLIRPTQPPEKFTTPDGSGSSTVKFKLPKPAMQTNQSAPQKPRGPVQTARNQGIRKEDTNGH